MQAQKQIHASQLWQQGLNDVILKSCDTIVLRTLPLVVQCKIFRWWVRKHESINTKKFAFLIVTLWRFFRSVFSCIRTEYGDLLCKFLYSVQIQENKDQEKLGIWTLFTQRREIMKVKNIVEKLSINNEKNILCTRENGSKLKMF